MAETLIPQVGIREDLSDLIDYADMKSTPVTTKIKKGSEPINPIGQWQVDAYADISVAGVLSNADATAFTDEAAQRTILKGVVQKIRRNPAVDDMAENVAEVAGIGKKKEFSWAVKKAIEEVKRNMESIVCSDDESQEQGAGLPYMTRGLGKWISNTAQNHFPVPAAFRTPANSINTTATASLLASDVQAVLQSIYEQTGQLKTFTFVCGPTLRRRFSAFQENITTGSTNTLAAARYTTASQDERKYIATVDVFEGDFGVLEIMPSLFLAKDQAVTAVSNARGYVLDMDDLSLDFNRKPGFKELPDLGGGPRGIVDAIFRLTLGNPLKHGKFAATT
jgi:hypothetical protein